MAPKKQKQQPPQVKPGGRPSQRLSECSTLIRTSRSMLEAVSAAAKEEGIPVSQWWREAAADRLEKAASAVTPLP